MTIEEVMKSDSRQLYPLLYYLIMSNPQNGLNIIEKFKASERYESDSYFKIAVDSANLIANGVVGKQDEIISLAPEVIERAEALKLWKLVATNWNNLGTTYATKLILEKALECYCHVINTEAQHGAQDLTSMAYYNLSSIFYDVGAHDKSLSYIEKAVDSLKPEEVNREIMAPRYLLYLSLHLQLLCRTGKLERARKVHDILQGAYGTESFRESQFSFRVAEMYYYFYTGDRAECRVCYDNIMALVDPRDTIRKYLVLEAYVDLCELFNVGYEQYGTLLLEVEGMPDLNSSYTMSRLYGWLRKYYISQNNTEAVDRLTPKYIELMERNVKENLIQKSHALESVESLLLGKTLSDFGTKNVELKLLADEAIKNKNALEAAYKNLEKMSSMDGLTHISSRRDFENRFLNMIAVAKVESKPVTVFMMDIDFFKLYNDTYGHLEGDEVLKKIAVLFRDRLEEVDGLAARFGGEEFIGACMGLTIEDSKNLAEKICEDIYELKIENKKAELGYVSVSIGVSVGEGISAEDRSKMMKQADISLYEAKNTGRNKIVLDIVEA